MMFRANEKQVSNSAIKFGVFFFSNNRDETRVDFFGNDEAR